MAKVIGIDWETTNSWMAVIAGGEPALFENSEAKCVVVIAKACLKDAVPTHVTIYQHMLCSGVEINKKSCRPRFTRVGGQFYPIIPAITPRKTRGL